MKSVPALDLNPVLGLFAISVVVVPISIEAGLRVADRRMCSREREREAPLPAIVGASLGLIAFMLTNHNGPSPQARKLSLMSP